MTVVTFFLRFSLCLYTRLGSCVFLPIVLVIHVLFEILHPVSHQHCNSYHTYFHRRKHTPVVKCPVVKSETLQNVPAAQGPGRSATFECAKTILDRRAHKFSNLSVFSLPICRGRSLKRADQAGCRLTRTLTRCWSDPGSDMWLTRMASDVKSALVELGGFLWAELGLIGFMSKSR